MTMEHAGTVIVGGGQTSLTPVCRTTRHIIQEFVNDLEAASIPGTPLLSKK